MLNFTANHSWQKANFGLERECLRVTEKGELSFTPHPAALGNKRDNPLITTDFSESQIEMITPVCTSIPEAVACLNELYDVTVKHIGEEYLWPASMPCVIPAGRTIPVAVYEGEAGRAATAYRQGLLKRYGGERQLISGMHFNFSFSQETLQWLKDQERDTGSMRDFTDRVYLRLTRNYLYHSWLITYWFGCSNVVDQSFDPRCVGALTLREDGSAILPDGVSLRASRWGYQNKTALYPDYDSVDAYVDSIYRFVEEGSLQEPKEFYTSVRLKPAGGAFDQLGKKGIGYLEFRNLDINPYCRLGIDGDTMAFFHVFLLYLLDETEKLPEDWQQEGRANGEAAAMGGLKETLCLRKNSRLVPAAAWAKRVLFRMQEIARDTGLPLSPVQDQRPAVRMAKPPYVEQMMKLAMDYKAKSASADPELRARIERYCRGE